MPTWEQYYWPIAMIIAFGLMFGIPKLYALFTNTANTLSWYAWRMLSIGITLHIWYRSW